MAEAVNHTLYVDGKPLKQFTGPPPAEYRSLAGLAGIEFRPPLPAQETEDPDAPSLFEGA